MMGLADVRELHLLTMQMMVLPVFDGNAMSTQIKD